MSKPSSHQRQARDFMQRQEWDAALQALEKAVSRNPNDPSLHNQMGDIQLHKQDVDAACVHFLKSIDIYASLGLHNNAVALCRKVIRLCPANVEVRYTLAKLRVDQGLLAEAVAFFEDYLDQMNSAHADAGEVLEKRCTEMLDLLGAKAPVGKIVEKLESTESHGAAYQIVQRQAQKATDAGNIEQARLYTEKMRSLRVMVERSGKDIDDASDAAQSGEAAPSPGIEPNLIRAESDGADSPASEAEAAALESPAVAPVDADGPAQRPAVAGSASVPEPGFIDLDAASHESLDAAISDLSDDTNLLAEEASGSGAGRSKPDGVDGTIELSLGELSSAPNPGAAETPALEPTFEIELDDDLPQAEAGESVAEVPGAEPSPDTDEGVKEIELEETGLEEFADLWQDPSAAAPEEAAPDAAASSGASHVGKPGPPPRDHNFAAGAGETAPGAGDPTPSFKSPGPVGSDVPKAPIWIPDESTDTEDPRPPAPGETHDLEDVIDTFRQQMSEALGNDAAARYDLGVAYFEMGLYNEALAEFEVAANAKGFTDQSLEMMAACLSQQGRHAEIIELLTPALQEGADQATERVGLRYCIGLAFEAMGRSDEARLHFEKVAQVDIGFKDVEARLQRF